VSVLVSSECVIRSAEITSIPVEVIQSLKVISPRFSGSVPTCYCLPVYHVARMPYRLKKLKKSEPKPGELKSHQFRADQRSDQRRREMSTRSTLSRLRNRKSDLK